MLINFALKKYQIMPDNNWTYYCVVMICVSIFSFSLFSVCVLLIKWNYSCKKTNEPICVICESKWEKKMYNCPIRRQQSIPKLQLTLYSLIGGRFITFIIYDPFLFAWFGNQIKTGVNQSNDDFVHNFSHDWLYFDTKTIPFSQMSPMAEQS